MQIYHQPVARAERANEFSKEFTMMGLNWNINPALYSDKMQTS